MLDVGRSPRRFSRGWSVCRTGRPTKDDCQRVALAVDWIRVGRWLVGGAVCSNTELEGTGGRKRELRQLEVFVGHCAIAARGKMANGLVVGRSVDENRTMSP